MLRVDDLILRARCAPTRLTIGSRERTTNSGVGSGTTRPDTQHLKTLQERSLGGAPPGNRMVRFGTGASLLTPTRRWSAASSCATVVTDSRTSPTLFFPRRGAGVLRRGRCNSRRIGR